MHLYVAVGWWVGGGVWREAVRMVVDRAGLSSWMVKGRNNVNIEGHKDSIESTSF